jgi:predicted transport protein
MTVSSLDKKLHIRPGSTMALLNAPAGITDLLEPLPEETKLLTTTEGKVDLRLLFVQNSGELATAIRQATDTLGDESNLWVAYPKLSSKITTALNRDQGWQSLTDLGFSPVANVAVFLPLYKQLVAKAQSLGDDVDLTIRQGYVAFTRGKQFALVKPSRNRLDLALKLPDAPQDPRLEAVAGVGSGSMIRSMTHRVVITRAEDIDQQVTNWLEQAYYASSK